MRTSLRRIICAGLISLASIISFGEQKQRPKDLDLITRVMISNYNISYPRLKGKEKESHLYKKNPPARVSTPLLMLPTIRQQPPFI